MASHATASRSARTARAATNDGTNVPLEAQIKHTVCLIQNQKNDSFEGHFAVTDEGKQSSGRGDQRMNALAQRRSLRLSIHSSVDARRVELHSRCSLLCDLSFRTLHAPVLEGFRVLATWALETHH